VAATKIFGSAALKVTSPFLIIENLLQSHKRVPQTWYKKYSSMLRPLLCDLHMTIASSRLQFIHPILKDTLCSGMGKLLERC
jgi:hypothetical protein